MVGSCKHFLLFLMPKLRMNLISKEAVAIAPSCFAGLQRLTFMVPKIGRNDFLFWFIIIIISINTLLFLICYYLSLSVKRYREEISVMRCHASDLLFLLALLYNRSGRRLRLHFFLRGRRMSWHVVTLTGL